MAARAGTKKKAEGERGVSQTDMSRALFAEQSAFYIDQDNSIVMRANLLESTLEGLLSRMEHFDLDGQDIKGVVIPAWLLAGELRRDLQELARTGTPLGRESTAPRERT